MHLLIEGELRHFVPIKEFRATFSLPDTFGIALFEAKDYSGLGRIDSAGAELNIVRRAVLDAVPAEMPPQEWLAYLPSLTRLFEAKMHEINPEVGLKNIEIEYAACGFQDVCQSLIYSMIQAQSADAPPPSFHEVYADWQSSTVRISSTVHSYVHQGEIWAIQIVTTAYGRVGMVIWTQDETHYVHDTSLGCPAEGFMHTLLQEVATYLTMSHNA